MQMVATRSRYSKCCSPTRLRHRRPGICAQASAASAQASAPSAMVWVPKPKIVYFEGQAADRENRPSQDEIDEAFWVLNRALGDILLVSGFRRLGEYPADCLWWAGYAAWEYVRERSWYGQWTADEWEQWHTWSAQWDAAEWAAWRQAQRSQAEGGGAAESGVPEAEIPQYQYPSTSTPVPTPVPVPVVPQFPRPTPGASAQGVR